MVVASPRLWSIATPNLYRIHTTVKSGGSVVDEYDTPIGIRRIAFDADRGFLLNGEQVKIKGVCIHHDEGSVGAAVPVAPSLWSQSPQPAIRRLASD